MGEATSPDLSAFVADWKPEPLLTSGRTTAWSVGAFSALLNVPTVARSGEPLPPLWHWFGFLDHPRQDQLGEDGHPAEGRFMPPLPDRRRMIAGGRLTVLSPMVVDEELERRTELTRCDVKSGRSGEMVLVTIRHEFLRNGTAVVVEEQDVVYRSQAPGQARGISLDVPDPDPEPLSAEAVPLLPDEAMLFRFSALTHNTHRIHYDHPYVTGVEGYPGLVVHGPLLALMLLEIPRRSRPDRRVRQFDYRLTRPAFVGHQVIADLDAEQSSDDRLVVTAGVRGAPASVSGAIEL